MTPHPLSLPLALATSLARHAHHSFGLIGNGNAHLVQGLIELGIPYVAVRHEAGAVAAADAYTRTCGKLAIATTTYGPGFTNALTALAEAAHARTPLVMLVGDAPTGGPRSWDVDQEMLAAAIGVRTYEFSVQNIDGMVDRAVSYAMRARRPVVLAVPYDLVTAPVRLPDDAPELPSSIDANDPAVLAELLSSVAAQAPEPAAQVPTPPSTASESQLRTAIDALQVASRPVIVAGHGAALSGARDVLGELAERTGALTATTALARGIFPDQEYDLGAIGSFGQPAAMEVLATADIAVVVGASLSFLRDTTPPIFGPDTTIIRVDDQWVTPPVNAAEHRHIFLQGDARRTLEELLAGFAASAYTSTGWRTTVSGLAPGGTLRVRDIGVEEHPDGVCRDGRLDPRAVAARIGELLPEQRRISIDGDHSVSWPNTFWPVTAPDQLIMVGAAFHTIGLGLSTIAGVAAAAPGSTTVLSTGDGGALMALSDLETAIRTAPSSIIVVWNDGAYGAEAALTSSLGGDASVALIPEVDFAALASAFGATGVSIRSLHDLDTLRSFTESGAQGTLLLDCHISRTVVPRR